MISSRRSVNGAAWITIRPAAEADEMVASSYPEAKPHVALCLYGQ